MANVADILHSLPDVRHYTVTWRNSPNEIDPFPLHRKVWPTFSVSLESLTLTTRFESFVLIVPQFTLPHLRFLSITLTLMLPSNQAKSEHVLVNKVRPFINSVHSTLDMLFLSLPPELVTDGFYDGLSPQLTLSHVGFGGDITLYPGAVRFLHRLAPTLKRLNFAPPKLFEDGGYSKPRSTLGLPNLLSLGVVLLNSEANLHHYRNLDQRPISCPLQYISSPKTLHIRVTLLSTHPLKYLAKALPNLKTLVVDYEKLDPCDDVDRFCQRLEDEGSILGWKLGSVAFARRTINDRLLVVDGNLTRRVAGMLPFAKAMLSGVEDSIAMV